MTGVAPTLAAAVSTTYTNTGWAFSRLNEAKAVVSTPTPGGPGGSETQEVRIENAVGGTFEIYLTHVDVLLLERCATSRACPDCGRDSRDDGKEHRGGAGADKLRPVLARTERNTDPRLARGRADRRQ